MIIPYKKLTFHISVEDTMHLPYYKGSTFRGAFGNAFRKIVCTLRRRECKECILNSRCIYAYVFETLPPDSAELMGMNKYEKVPHPFIIEPPEETKQEYGQGEKIAFGLVLVGKAVDYLPYFILTFEELGKIGLGRGRGKYVLLQVNKNGSVVYSQKDKTIHSIDSDMVDIPEGFDFNRWSSSSFNKNGSDGFPSEAVEIECITPLRIMHERKLATSLEFHILIRNLLRRLNMLHYFHCEMNEATWDHNSIIEAARTVTIKESLLRWHDWERYSSRQQTKMKMGGLIGKIHYEGPIGNFMPLLKAGEILHAGKGTSFGLGKFSVLENKPGKVNAADEQEGAGDMKDNG